MSTQKEPTPYPHPDLVVSAREAVRETPDGTRVGPRWAIQVLQDRDNARESA